MFTIPNFPARLRFCIVLLLSLGLSYTRAQAEDTQPEPPTFPTAKKWAGQDYRNAVAYLTHLSKTDPDNLPRIDDEDGRFNLLIKNLKRVTDTMDMTTEDGWQQLYVQESKFQQWFTNQILMPIFTVYGASKNNFHLSHEREVLIILPMLIDSTGYGIKALRLLTDDILTKDPATWPEGIAVKHDHLFTVTGSTTHAMLRLTIRPGINHPNLRSKILNDSYEPLTQLLWAMKEDDRNKANTILELLKSFLEDPDEQAIVDKLIQSPRQPLTDTHLMQYNQVEPQN